MALSRHLLFLWTVHTSKSVQDPRMENYRACPYTEMSETTAPLMLHVTWPYSLVIIFPHVFIQLLIHKNFHL